jgi:hypothetical protein
LRHQDRDGGTLMIEPAARSAFLDGIKAGEFGL